jgi:hypothetical protein
MTLCAFSLVAFPELVILCAIIRSRTACDRIWVYSKKESAMQTRLCISSTVRLEFAAFPHTTTRIRRLADRFTSTN